ncbi:hypothetical protein [Capillimicrobium parvum]|uniref:Uncharacterized protein n=1 Tax=Capillimicrobium parvum TaxID=2884022 RepID=A0A9E6Y125_9ACTN|nr:hypothetical protein [Capillimicrobium parvum]UGS37818.1 hypothetical protein DSM104329_04239 [Capillimicrobium parvum]
MAGGMFSSRRPPHLAFLLAGLGLGLVLALPIDLSGAGCPAPGEGRNMCLVQDHWAPALTTVALCVAGAWLLAGLLLDRIPELRRGDRRRMPPRRGHGRDAIEADEVLRAATWGVLPPPPRRARRPQVTVAAIVGGPSELRVVRPGERPRPPAGRTPRRVRARRAPGTDREVLAACWDAATQRSARLVDAAAHELGLALEPLRGLPRGHDPDPLLAAARWARDERPERRPGVGRRLRERFAERAAPVPEVPISDPLLRAAMWVRIPESSGDDRGAA